MRLAVILILTAALAYAALQVSSSPPAPSEPDLRAFYDAHDWFKLRDAIAGKDALPLYRGAVAAAFGKEEEAAESLHPLINGSTSSKDADEADDWLSYMFVRTGQYQKAAAEMDEGSPLLSTLRNLPNQSVSHSEPSVVACRLSQRRLFVPVTIQGKPTEFFLDSDANFSFISESEARSLGLNIQESTMTVHGAGGLQSGFRTAVADDLVMGAVQLKHVAFMVMPDAAEIFTGLETGQQGAIGLPVLLAFHNLRYRKGELDFALPPSKMEAGDQNLCFDGLDPVAQVSLNQQKLPVVLDTGAALTELWPPFAHQFPAVVNSSGKSGSAVENSFGGKSRIPEKLLPDLMLGLDGCGLHIHPARVLLAQTTPNSQRYYGRLGLDALTSVHELTLNFEDLRISVH